MDSTADKPRMAIFRLAVVALIPFSAAAHEPGAHVHGAGKLEVAVDGNTLSLTLESPLDSLLGFEHRPRTARQKAAVRAMADTLNKPAALFVTTPAAGCTPATVKLESPVLDPAGKGGSGGHADLDGAFVFRCERPQALRGIDVKLFAAFPHLRRLDVAVVTSGGQSAVRLTPRRTRVSW